MPFPLHESRDTSTDERPQPGAPATGAAAAPASPAGASAVSGGAELIPVAKMISMPKSMPFIPRLAAVSEEIWGLHV